MATTERGGSVTDLRGLAEQATPGSWDNDSGTGRLRRPAGFIGGINDLDDEQAAADAAYIAAANPQAILALLDEVDWLSYNATGREQELERRVAALEEGLRVLLDARMGNYGQQVGAENKARALLASASNEAEVPAAPPADDGTPYQSPDLHTGTEHSDRVLTDDK